MKETVSPVFSLVNGSSMPIYSMPHTHIFIISVRYVVKNFSENENLFRDIKLPVANLNKRCYSALRFDP